jgi:CRP-like cAMP-binding protein
LFVVKSGTVEIRLGNRLLDTLPERSIFGEMALIDRGPRSATAVAATDATLVPVGEKQFLLMVSRTPYFALNVRSRAAAAYVEQRDLLVGKRLPRRTISPSSAPSAPLPPPAHGSCPRG